MFFPRMQNDVSVLPLAWMVEWIVTDSRHSPMKSQIPDAPVQITIDDPSMMRKKRWDTYE